MNTQSEFICQVVRVVATEPHPNADKLDLVTITLDGKDNFPDKIVNSRGDMQPGELVVYVGPDSVVPLSGPFNFLNSRLDAKGKTHYRIRSSKIRGVYSPGLLVRLPDGYTKKLGTDVSDILGVTNYVGNADTNEQPTGTRNVSKVRKKVDLYPVYTVTSLKKAPNLFREGEEVYVTEKLHGTNFRFGYGGRKRFYYGTHRTNLADNRPWYSRLYDAARGRSIVSSNPGFDNPWARAVKLFDLEKACKDAPDYIFYAEIVGPKIQSGFGYGTSDINVYVFDVYDTRSGYYLTPKEAKLATWNLGLTCVPNLGNIFDESTILSTHYHKDIVNWAELNSTVDGGIMEGIVIEAKDRTWYGGRRKAKWVSRRYHLRGE